MKSKDCCLVVVVPKPLEEPLIDLLLCGPDDVGFTTSEVEGHGRGTVYRSTREQVRGRGRNVRVEVILARQTAGALLERLKSALPNREIAYWIHPVDEFGRFA